MAPKESISLIRFGNLEQAVKDLPDKLADKIAPLHEELHTHIKHDEEMADKANLRMDNMDKNMTIMGKQLIEQNGWWSVIRYIFIQLVLGSIMAILLGVTVFQLNKHINLSFLSYITIPYELHS